MSRSNSSWLFYFRSNDELVIVNYLTKFKEKVLTLIASPKCYYNSTMECFITLGDNMAYSTEEAEVYTSPTQLQDLIEICGTEGYIWLSAQIELDVNSAVHELMKIVQV